MSMNKNDTLSAPWIQIRWLTYNCTQIKLPDGTCILVDPCLAPEDDEFFGHYNLGTFPKDLERVDYVIFTHTHGDHVCSAGEVYRLYRPRFLAHYITAIALCENMDIPYSAVTPITNDQSYDFGTFKLETFQSCHVVMGPPPADGEGKPKLKNYRLYRPELKELGNLGTIFNTNFIISAGIRVGIAAGLMDRVRCQEWNTRGVDLFLRQYFPADRPIKRSGEMWESFAEELAFVGAPLSLPIHHEMTYDRANGYDEMNEFTEKVNAVLKQKQSACRMLNPIPGTWYNVSYGIKRCDE